MVIDFVMAVCVAVGIGCFRFLLNAMFFKNFAIRILYNGNRPLKIDEARQVKIEKMSESMWKFSYFLIGVIWSVSIICNESWSRDIHDYFRGWPDHPLKVSMKLFYIWQCGIYIYSIVAILTWETRRKDFPIMLSHHIITIILIVYSYLVRIGCIIIALHDTCDIFLEVAKVLKYIQAEMGASIFFGIFAISWFLLRLVYFPFWVIRSSSYLSIEFISASENFIIMYYVFNSMLISLLFFHVYWWKLICSMILTQIKNRANVGEDVRSGHTFRLGFVGLCGSWYESWYRHK
ncbi:LAG1 longevity assurance-like protein [Zostera marina]|uniref:LAG1 longevity assurance-like protein n=1 Tax=Zostera marina TaxID=29655 RepID=A0A0K9PYT0_ZOSMR|nr:LAG1 longevity assurance-like protein [Zostera marina]